MPSHDRCWDCDNREEQQINFPSPFTPYKVKKLDVEYCKEIDVVLSPELKNMAYLCNCRSRKQKVK